MTRSRTALRAAAATAALAAALVARPAIAYVRNTASGTGVPLAWPVPFVPWHLNRDWPNTSPSCRVPPGGGDPALDAVQASFAQWEQSCTDLRLLYAGTASDIRVGGGGTDANVVVFRRGWCSQNPAIVDQTPPYTVRDGCITDPDVDCGDLYDCFEDSVDCAGQASCADWGIVAQTSVLYVPSTGRIVDADIEVNGWDGQGSGSPVSPPKRGWYFTCYAGTQPSGCTTYGQGSCGYMDLQNTVTHEVGHFIGLRHPCTTKNASGQLIDPDLPLCTSAAPAGALPYTERTMSPTTQPGELAKRSLSQDEVNAVCAIYPKTEGGCGCGAGGADGAALLLAVAALRPLRRRAAR